MFNFLNPTAFEKFPRQPLVFRVSRRRFFSTMLEALHVSALETQGVPSRSLSALGELPDELLAGSVPQVFPDCAISLEDGYVWAKPAQATRPMRLFPAKDPALAAFNLFNGKQTLDEASRLLAAQTGWKPARSFAYIRGLFLYLVQHLVCQPRQA